MECGLSLRASFKTSLDSIWFKLQMHSLTLEECPKFWFRFYKERELHGLLHYRRKGVLGTFVGTFALLLNGEIGHWGRRL